MVAASVEEVLQSVEEVILQSVEETLHKTSAAAFLNNLHPEWNSKRSNSPPIRKRCAR